MENTKSNSNISSTYPTDIKVYQKVQIIGKGAFSTVFEGKVMIGPHQGETVAIKQVNLEDLGEKLLSNLSVIF